MIPAAECSAMLHQLLSDLAHADVALAGVALLCYAVGYACGEFMA